MKNCSILLLCILAASPAFSQKKGKTNPKDIKIDSLTKATVTFSGQVDSLLITTDSLSTQLDSVSKEQVIYYGLYTTIKEKVLKRDFDPAKLSQIIDSLAAGRDAKFSGLAATSVSLMDSITVLKKENTQMKMMMGSITAEETAKNRLVSELKVLKELLDSHILTQGEFDSKKAILLQKWQ